MNAPLHLTTPAPCGSIAELRAFIGETMALTVVHAAVAETYATLGDDRGLEYAMRCFAASSKAAFDTLADLKAANNVWPAPSASGFCAPI